MDKETVGMIAALAAAVAAITNLVTALINAKSVRQKPKAPHRYGRKRKR